MISNNRNYQIIFAEKKCQGGGPQILFSEYTHASIYGSVSYVRPQLIVPLIIGAIYDCDEESVEGFVRGAKNVCHEA